ncbi:hypothetical protein R6Q57_006272 [Mikania cordata]
MLSSYKIAISSGTKTICCSDCQAFVSEDEDTHSQSNKLISNRKSLHVFFDKMFHRKDIQSSNSNSNSNSKSNSNSLSSNEKSIRSWETTKGKRALLCGFTYDKQKYKLKGSTYDVINMRKLLISRFQFPATSIRVLAEMESHPQPTKRNIQEALRWLVKDNQPGESLVFYFSGHGLWRADFFDDEIDGFNESICPLDFRTEGLIIDNEINDTIVRPLKNGVKLHAIIDACHSGTILDLPHVHITKENHWLDNRSPSGVYKGTSGGHAISISACEDNQLAVDTSVS